MNEDFLWFISLFHANNQSSEDHCSLRKEGYRSEKTERYELMPGGPAEPGFLVIVFLSARFSLA